MPRAPVIGTCKLCHQTEAIERSHTIPHWAFGRLTKGHTGEGPPLPVFIMGGTAELSQEQCTDRLLCRKCENKLGVWENYVSRCVRQLDGSFPALNYVKNLRELKPPKPGVLAGHFDGLNIAYLAKFALSVIWRASVSRKFPGVQLEHRHEEQLRAFLLEDEGWSFPEQAVLHVELICIHPDDERRVDQLVTMPATHEEVGFNIYFFTICGLCLHLFLGDGMPPLFEQACAVRKKSVTLSRGDALFQGMAQQVQQAKPKGKLLNKQG